MSWWCTGGEPYTACGLFEGNVEDNAPESPSKTTHVELEFVELPRRDGEVEMSDMGCAWMQPPSQLPYATATEGVGGRLKAKCEHFRVTELLRNAPDGKRDRGDACHYVLRIRRQNRTTEWVRRRLQEAFGLSSYRDVGVCGQKDKRAVIVQHFSVPSFSPKFERNVPLGECKMLAPCRGDLEVLEVMVSSTKLRRGSHRSNAFQIVLTGVDRDALEACELTLKRLQFTGVPNYFGPQRFGKGCATALRGYKDLKRLEATSGSERRKLRNSLRHEPMKRFACEAFASSVFNCYVAERLRRETFDARLEGDLTSRKGLSGGSATAQETLTGPLVGRDLLKPAEGTKSAIFEGEVLQKIGIQEETVASVLEGKRRIARLPVPDVQVSQHEEGVLFEFSLPVGCYATSVLREFAKCDLSSTCDSGDDSDGDRTVEEAPVIERNGKKGVRFAASRAEAGRGRRLERWLVDKSGKRGDPPRLRAKKRVNGEVRKRRAKKTVDYDEVT